MMPPVNANGMPVRDASKYQQTILDIVEHHEQQDKHQQQGHRNDNSQARRCRLQLLEGAAPTGMNYLL
jgi:hypothetical protein